MPLDHPLGRKEGLDLFAQKRNALRLLNDRMKIMKSRRQGETDPHPFGTLSAKAEALETETDTCLTVPLRVRLLVTLLQRGVSGYEGTRMTMSKKADLSPYPTSVTARLSAHCTLSFWRPGFLGDFSRNGSRGRRYVAADGRIVRH